MKIDRLRLLGFKSFVEPTELQISAGLTGVVGPNGCGKSNLLEALRWVMGETSYKSMRGSNMEDVIFSGTAGRPARNSAEVTLFLDNTDRLAPTEFNDTDQIEITRRIERDAGSAYRINGREARARDIKILFEDAATGARSPALVRQGQISDIVNAKPQQRRRILEDAAGIAGLHSRRHEAELRLKAADANLERLQDVLGQLNSQVDSLKRQARQAKRYKEISHKIRTTEALALHLSWKAAQEHVNACEAQLAKLTGELAELTQNESKATRTEAELAEALQPLREDEAKHAASVSRLKLEAESLSREATRAQQRRDELVERQEQLKRDQDREEAQLKDATDSQHKLRKEIAQLTAAQEKAKETEAATTTKLAGAETKLAEQETQLTEMTQAAAHAKAQRSASEKALRERAETIQRLERQLIQLTQQAEEISAQAPETTQLAQTIQAATTLAQSIGEIEISANEAEHHIAKLSAAREHKQEALAEANLTARALQSECETLAKLLLPVTSTTQPAIVDDVDVDPGYERAFGAALGDDLDAPTDTEQSIHWRIVETREDDAALPDGAIALKQYVDAPEELARRLSQVGIVDAAAGPELQSSLQPGQRLVSLDGDLWRWDGYVARADGETPAAKRLAERNRLVALEKEKTAALEKVQEASRSYDSAAKSYADADVKAKQAREAWREAQSDLTNLRDDISAMERQARQAETQLAGITGARSRSEQDLADAKTSIAAIEQEHQNHIKSDNLDHRLVDVRQTTQDQRQRVSDQKAQLLQVQQDAHLRATRITTANGELETWSRRAENATQQLETLGTRASQTKSEIDELANVPHAIEEKRQHLNSEITSAEAGQRTAADALALRETDVKSAQKNLRDLHEHVSAAREQRARSDANLEAAKSRYQDEVQRIADTLKVAPEDCLPLAERPDDEQHLPLLADVETKLSKLKADRERLGGVNLAADADLEKIAEDFNALDAERADVEMAIEKLRSAIGQLNREGRKRLREAFDTVNGHFGELFSTLFGGGEARLEMIDSDDPLEGGLEIIAKPPGKKPATLSLLSGGEQTLTALSLIFAVFLTNPSPICVLDEVDAPLDDANVDRFCTLMEKMSKSTETRFLVITHHPMTMTRMNRLFGVTMSERGVSQLVSVDLETAQGFREAS